MNSIVLSTSMAAKITQRRALIDRSRQGNESISTLHPKFAAFRRTIRAGIDVCLVPYASRRTYEDKGNDIDSGAGLTDCSRRPGSRTIRHDGAAGLLRRF